MSLRVIPQINTMRHIVKGSLTFITQRVICDNISNLGRERSPLWNLVP